MSTRAGCVPDSFNTASFNTFRIKNPTIRLDLFTKFVLHRKKRLLGLDSCYKTNSDCNLLIHNGL